MIAEPNRHIEHDTLKALLDETLPGEQAELVETHLCQCGTCQGILQQIAGEETWWSETASVLSASTLGPRTSPDSKPDQRMDDNIDPSIDWIRPLLDRSADALGQIDQYTIDGVVGQGGMGVVLRGTDPELHRAVAIKLLSPHLAGVGAARARFMREAQAAATIIHPAIVPIYSIATAGRFPYIVMPLIAGGNLQERLNQEGPLELAEILRIALQIAEGLAAAHRQGVIHRDIKPANTLIEEGNGRVLISDFGLARALDDATLTISGMIAGTPQFMSPEQARGDVIDVRSDLFSLGSLMYALATGRPPYRAESPLAVLRKISESVPRPVHEINERIPAWLDEMIQRFMRIDPSKRIQTADQAVKLLREGLGHARSPLTIPPPQACGTWFTRKRLTAFVLLAVLIAAGITALLLFQARIDGARARSDAELSGITVEPAPVDPAMSWQGELIDAELTSVMTELERLAGTLSEEASASRSTVAPLPEPGPPSEPAPLSEPAPPSEPIAPASLPPENPQ